jgi:threonine dehydrogenase-like Zn-dependent dehydrogenase
MKVYHLVGKQQVALQDDPLPVLGPHDVLVKSQVSALSVGTEVWRYINFGHYGGEGGLCGYNSLGEVVAVGAEVTRFRVGDLAFATHPHSEYFAVPENRAVNMPPGVDREAAAFTYLPTLGLHGLRSAHYQAGDHVLVVGLGIVGLLAAQVARMVGARVAALEVDAARRQLASQLGFGLVFDPREPATASQLGDYFRHIGPDVILETSQSWSGLMDGVRLARLSTRLSIVGIYRSDPPPEVANELLRLTLMNRDLFHNQRLQLIGCSNDPIDDYPPGVVRWNIQRNCEYIAGQIVDGALDTRRVITHRFRWDELEQAYRRFESGDRSMVGVVLHWDP